MMTIPIATFSIGVLLFLVSLPVILLSFVTSYGVFVAGLIIGAIGVSLAVFGAFLKLASLLFRA